MDWQAAGVWEQLHHRLLDWLGDDGQVDWSRAAIDPVSVRARHGGSSLAQVPVDRGKPGSKSHLLIDATGLPLAVGLSAANTHDSRCWSPWWTPCQQPSGLADAWSPAAATSQAPWR